MSGLGKLNIKGVSPKEEDHLESPLPAFPLHEEESRRYFFHDRQLEMEPEDHLFLDFEVPDCSEVEAIKKEE